MDMSPSKVRTVITINRPAGHYSVGPGLQADYRHGETWNVVVTQVPMTARTDFVVEAQLITENRHDRTLTIPGVRLGPETYTTLAKARKRAYSMADVVSGMLHPEYEIRHFDVQGKEIKSQRSKKA